MGRASGRKRNGVAFGDSLTALQARLRGVPKISLEDTVEGLRSVQSRSASERVSLCDEIFVSQPNLLVSVLCLRKSGVSLAEMDVLLLILMACLESAQVAGVSLPTIYESVQDICIGRLVGQATFSEGLTDEENLEAIEDRLLIHPEIYLYSLAIGLLKENNLLEVRNEAEKMLVICTLNIVNTMAYVLHEAPTARRP